MTTHAQSPEEAMDQRRAREAAAVLAGDGASGRAPRTVEETGLSFLFLVELIAKVLFLRGKLALPQLVSHVKLAPGPVGEILAFMRREHLCEMVRRSDRESDVDYELNGIGKSRAAEYLARCQYAGPAPVSLQAYGAQVARQAVSGLGVTRQEMQETFKDVVVTPAVLDKLGAAMNSGRAIMIYGPAGSGKTYLAERLHWLMRDEILVPHAIVVDEEIVQVYDPLVHRAVEVHGEAASSFEAREERELPALRRAHDVPEARQPRDRRWVLCERPVAISGGELSLGMLDLRFDEAARFYQAPPHVKANNGIYIIDDLGRQLVSARDLMNRLIVPLDRERDYLSLHNGCKFVVPFDTVVLFSTNLAPASLADESFLRRLGSKIHVGPLEEHEYRRVFEQYCAQFGIRFDEAVFAHLLHEYHRREGRPLLACYPRDLLGLIRDFGRYEGCAPELTGEAIARAWSTYFVTER